MKKWRSSDFGLTGVRAALFIAVTLAAALFEGAGMGMLLPLLQYIEKGQDISAFAESSRMWSRLVDAFGVVGLEVTFTTLLLAVFVLISCRVVVVFLREVYSAWLSQGVLHAIRCNLFETYANMGYSSFSKFSTGKIVNVTTIEAQRVCSYFISLFALISNGVIVVGFLVLMVALSVEMSLLAIGLLGLAGVLVAYSVRWTKRVSRRTTLSNSDFAFVLVERLTAMRLIKTCAVERRETALVKDRSDDVRENNFQLGLLKARVGLILEPCVVLATVGILYFAVTTFKMELAQIGVFMLIMLRLLPLSKEMLRSRQTLHANSGGLYAVSEALDEGHRGREAASAGVASFEDLREGIDLRGVNYSYPGQDECALKDIDVHIPAGSMTALVGRSGAGKSTFVDILPRLLVPESGEVQFDGRDASGIDLHSLRRAMAFVSQEACVINDTVFANVAFGKADATREDVRAALDKARALAFVEKLPQGLDTILGERGTKLSGGQRQRLSLARAFVQCAPILILDEPTSALDSEVEKDIQDAIAEVRSAGETTVIIIAHRMSTIRSADKIIVLDDGRVVQQGTHDELMRSGQWYSMVNDLQNE